MGEMPPGLQTSPKVIETPGPDPTKPLYPTPGEAELLANFDKEFAGVMAPQPGPPGAKYDEKRVEALTRSVREGMGIQRQADGSLIGKAFRAGISVESFLNTLKDIELAYAQGNERQRAEMLTLATDAFQYFNEKSAPAAGQWDNWANYGATRPRFDIVYRLAHLVPQEVGDTFAEKIFFFQALGYGGDPGLQMDHLKSYGAEATRVPVAVRDPKRRLALIKMAHKYTGDLILAEGNFNSEGGPSHHGLMHYYYANYSIDMLFNSLMAYHRAGWYFSDAVYEKVRRIAYAAAFVTSGSHFVHPFNGGGRPGLPLNMIASGKKWLESAARTGYGGNPAAIQPVFGGAFAYYFPEDPSAKEFLAAGIKPSPFPEGNIAVNFGNLVSHRRKEWNITAAGIAPSSRHMEIYSWVQYNHYALYARAGSHIITDPSFADETNDAGLEVSNGFNWAFVPGATCPATPAYRLMVRQSKNYIWNGGMAGGCSLGGNGVWADNQGANRGANFRKSGFFFGDHATFLTTNVAAVIPKDATEGEKQIHTTLLQWPVKSDSRPLRIDGREIASQPEVATLPLDRPRVLVDSKDNAYIVGANPKAHLAFRRGSQTFHMLRDIYVIDKKSPQPIDWHKMLLNGQPMNDQNLKAAEALYTPRSGDYEMAWIEHGLADGSDAAGSAYHILPMAGRTRADQFAKELSSNNPPAKILRMDKDVHALKDRDSGCIGYAIFTPGARIDVTGPLISSSNQATLLFRKNSDRSLTMSIAVPIDGKPRDTTVMINGYYSPVPPPGQRMEVTHLPDKTTRLRWLQHGYAAATFELESAGGPARE